MNDPYDRWCEAETDAYDAYYDSLATIVDEGDWFWEDAE